MELLLTVNSDLDSEKEFILSDDVSKTYVLRGEYSGYLYKKDILNWCILSL